LYGDQPDIGEPPVIDPYGVLGLDRDAPADKIKTAYRKAALKYHPGQHDGPVVDMVWRLFYQPLTGLVQS